MVGLRRLIPTATAKEIIMDNNRYQLQYELDLIEETLEKVKNREIWWLNEEDITELEKRKNLLEIIL
jgi:hypothetical protein